MKKYSRCTAQYARLKRFAFLITGCYNHSNRTEVEESVRSMTGCGSGKVSMDGWEVTVDLKTVNHRFLDLGLRLPRNLAFLEPIIREQTAKHIRRGHADIFLTVSRTGNTEASRVQCNPELAALYYDAAFAIAERTGAPNQMTVRDLMELEGVLTLTESEMDEEAVEGACAQALEEACRHLAEMREKEGSHLKTNLALYLDQASKLRDRISMRAPKVVAEYREKLEARLRMMNAEGVDPQRLAQEVAIMADRCAIDEELARLASHFSQMRTYLEADGEIGKKMDFLIQEMNREANTIGSKASDAEIAQLVVDLKSEIEKLREQIQNVE